MPIFTQSLRKIDMSNPQEALKEMANHIRYIQEQLEYTLMNLDSSNVTEIDTDQTNIGSSTGGSSFTGNSITLNGSNGESFESGVVGGTFRFTVKGKGGTQIMYLTSDGQLVITNHATIHIDGGEW
jgi:hypothetical protein